MGRRQRHTQFINVSVEELERMLQDKRLPTAERLKIVSELKFWKRRNRQKRSK